MPLTTKAAVLLTAPELSTVTDDQWTQAIDDAELLMNSTAFDTRAELAARYLVAHLLTMSQRRGGGNVSSVSVGPVSVQYGISVASDASTFDQTSYGRQFKLLARLTGWRSEVL